MVTEQRFRVGLRDDGEEVTDRVGLARIAQTGADAAFGDLGELG